MTTSLQALQRDGVLSVLDVELARLLCELAAEPDERVALAIALVSRHVGQGHVCLPLSAVTSGELIFQQEPTAAALPQWPEHAQWLAALRASKLVGPASASTPVVLDERERLYLRRYFAHERALSERVRARLAEPDVQMDAAALRDGLDRMFGPIGAGPDLQRQAAELALRRPFCVISGGPGTGKTSTVLKILALLVEQALAAGRASPRIHLMAPTGKAAARMHETIRGRKHALQCSEAVRAAIPEQAATIHRVLIEASQSTSAHGAKDRPALATDVVLVDEASMVDLALMSRLFAALPPSARVILLGDKHQLASVEAGAVLGDLCGAGLSPERLAAAPVVHLLKSHRYAADSGIGALASAIRDGDAERVLAVIADPRWPDVELVDEPSKRGLGAALEQAVVRGFSPCLTARDPLGALQRFDDFRVLCAHRHGARGAVSLNELICSLFVERGLLRRFAAHVVGAPILVTQNDYRLRLWNGDIGIVAAGVGQSSATACFVGAPGELRRLGITRLPAHEHAFAMSVHKSQGSEVDEVAVVLPQQRSAVLSRELLYTAVTRARKRVVLYASPALVRHTVETSIARSSGLAELLYP